MMLEHAIAFAKLGDKENTLRLQCLVIVLLAILLVGCGSGTTPADPKSLTTSHPVVVVTSVEQASKLVQQFERELHDEMYGKEGPHPPFASEDKPYSVVEKGEYYVFEFRKPFGPVGGGYIKMFYVHKLTGKVTRGAWTLGR